MALLFLLPETYQYHCCSGLAQIIPFTESLQAEASELVHVVETHSKS